MIIWYEALCISGLEVLGMFLPPTYRDMFSKQILSKKYKKFKRDRSGLGMETDLGIKSGTGLGSKSKTSLYACVFSLRYDTMSYHENGDSA